VPDCGSLPEIPSLRSVNVDVPPPEHQPRGPGATDKNEEEVNVYMRKAFSQTIENLDDKPGMSAASPDVTRTRPLSVVG